MGTSVRARRPWRVLNADRSYNVELRGGRKRADLYHFLLRIGWPKFFISLACLYLLANLLFGSIYFLLGSEQIEGLRSTGSQRFLDCFFFSVQTLATIGYGRMNPVGLLANMMVTIEALTGLVGVALGTGLCFARFSRPTARLRFSRVALISDWNGQKTFIFRMANERLNRIVDANMSVVFARSEKTTEGQFFWRLHDLQLVRSRTPLFSLTWTIMHPITESSPLYGMTKEKLIECEAEIFATVTGTDDTFAQPIHDRYSYGVDDLAWGAQFRDIVLRRPDGGMHVDLGHIDSIL